MFDLGTIVKALQVVGETTPAGTMLFEAFIAGTRGSDQEDLKERYAAARKRSDDLHDEVQRA